MRCTHRLTYSNDRCENEATHSLEYVLGDNYKCEPMCLAHAKNEALKIISVGGMAAITLGVDEEDDSRVD